MHVTIISHLYWTFDTESPGSELDAFSSFFYRGDSDASFLQEKHDKVSIVELRNGKVIFKQKPISFEKQSDTLQGESSSMD